VAGGRGRCPRRFVIKADHREQPGPANYRIPRNPYIPTHDPGRNLGHTLTTPTAAGTPRPWLAAQRNRADWQKIQPASC